MVTGSSGSDYRYLTFSDWHCGFGDVWVGFCFDFHVHSFHRLKDRGVFQRNLSPGLTGY